MMQGICHASFTRNSFHFIDTTRFILSQRKSKIKEATCECRQVVDILVSQILQPRVNYPLSCYYFKSLR